MERSSGSLMIQRNIDVHIVEFLDTSILDQANIEAIKSEILALVEKSAVPKIILSFEGVRHISSAVLGALMSINKEISKKQGELRLSSIDKQLMEVFKLTRLDKMLNIYKSTDAAMKKFSSV